MFFVLFTRRISEIINVRAKIMCPRRFIGFIVMMFGLRKDMRNTPPIINGVRINMNVPNHAN